MKGGEEEKDIGQKAEEAETFSVSKRLELWTSQEWGNGLIP